MIEYISIFLEYLNNNSGAINAIFSMVVAISTVFYVCLTRSVARETVLLRKAQTNPLISISVETLDDAIHILRLNIKNIGSGPALNINFSWKVIAGDEGAESLVAEFTKSNFFKTGINNLGPGKERFSHYTVMTEHTEVKLQSVLEFEVKYSSLQGEEFKEKIIIDMSEHSTDYQLGTPHLAAIAKSIEKIQKDISSYKAFSRLKVDIYTSKNRDDELKSLIERAEEFKAKNK